MEEFICVTVLSRRGEAEAEFSARLSHFWTHMLRDLPDDFEKVYAETTQFEEMDGSLSRQYLAEESVIDLLEREMKAHDIAYRPIDRDDVYSKYEASGAGWMQIEH